MKNRLFWKVIIILPLIIFIDYVLMAILGCTTCLFGLGEDYYCGSYCLLGKIILFLSFLFFIRIIFPDLRRIYKSSHYGQTAEEKKNS